VIGRLKPEILRVALGRIRAFALAQDDKS